ncbi:allantoin permease, partial [Klebsiella pneumoniae]|nr:allantoin permease [Klebsiella pneumoniae]MCJ6477129.1 allantoin permease [Klebsiella pneumoniae]
DISFNKGLLKLAPAQPEYRRGMIYNVNPVGVVSFGLAAGLSICAFFGLLGATLAPFSPLIALVVAFVMTPLMGLLTRGRYYIKQVDDGIAEPRYDAAGNASTTVYQCVSCEEEYERPDVMHSHKHQGAICSLCKSME